MEQLQQVTSIIALSMGVAWASGINLYAAIATLGLLGASGNMTLPDNLLILQEPIVIGAALLMYAVEFVADKIPGVDTGWDTVHTFIRVPAGALLAAQAVGDVNPAFALAAALVGGSLAAGTHLTKAGTRLAINTSPEPFSNIATSVAEDATVVGGLYLAALHPLLFIGLLVLFILLMVWALPRLWRFLRGLLQRIAGAFRPPPAATPPAPPVDDEDTLP